MTTSERIIADNKREYRLKIKSALLLNDKTMAELADKIGTSRTYVYDVVGGRKACSAEQREKILKAAMEW